MADEIIEIFQRNSRSLRLKATTGPAKVPLDLSGAQIIFVMKNDMADDDFDAVLVKKTANLPNGSDSQIFVVTAPPPKGGTPLPWIMDIFLIPEDLTVDIEPKTYFIQVDVIYPLTDKRYSRQGNITIRETGIKSL